MPRRSLFGLCGKLIAVDGQRDSLMAVLLEASSVLEDTPECHEYVVSAIDGESEAVWVTELWENEDAHARSLQDERVRAVIHRGLPLVADIAQQVRLTPVGGKGLDASKPQT